MAEVYGQLAHSVQLAVASADEVPKAGFPYADIFSRVLAQPDIAPADLAKVLVDSYVETYTRNKQPVSLSVSQVGGSDSLALAVKQLAHSLTTRIQEPLVLEAIVDSRKKAEILQEQSYVDLGSFCFGLVQSNLGETSQLAGAVLAVLEKNYVLCRGAFPNNPEEHMNGVSVLLPLSLEAQKERHQEGYRGRTLNAQVDWNAYRALTFSKDSDWDSFIDAFVGAGP
jgi:Clostripain family